MIIGPGKAAIPSKGGFAKDILLASPTAPLHLFHSVTESCYHCSSLCPTVPTVPDQPQAAGICGQLLATELTLCGSNLCLYFLPSHRFSQSLSEYHIFAKSLCSGQGDHKLWRSNGCVNIILWTEAHTKHKPTQFRGKHFFQDSCLNDKNKSKR